MLADRPCPNVRFAAEKNFGGIIRGNSLVQVRARTCLFFMRLLSSGELSPAIPRKPPGAGKIVRSIFPFLAAALTWRDQGFRETDRPVTGDLTFRGTPQ